MCETFCTSSFLRRHCAGQSSYRRRRLRLTQPLAQNLEPAVLKKQKPAALHHPRAGMRPKVREDAGFQAPCWRDLVTLTTLIASEANIWFRKLAAAMGTQWAIVVGEVVSRTVFCPGHSDSAPQGQL